MNKNNISIKDYPLRKNRSELLFTQNGVNINDVTLENMEAGIFEPSDCRITKEGLTYQAQIAEQDGNLNLAANFYRAAELVSIDSVKVIEIYNALRPYRSTEEELLNIADELKEKYNAENTAQFVHEAAAVLKKRKKLKGDR